VNGPSRLSLAVALAGAACAPGPQAAAPTPDPAAPVSASVYRSDPAITAADLRRRLFAFADDSMGGREAGSPGGVTATDYIAAELRRMGVEPAGENGTYFQTLPYTTRAFDTTMTIVANGEALVHGTDYLALPNFGREFPYGLRANLDSVRVIYGGPLGDANAVSPDQTAGRLVVFAAPTSPIDVQAYLGQMPAKYPKALAIAFAFLDFIPAAQRNFLSRPQVGEGVEIPDGPVGLLVTLQAAARLLGTSPGGATVGKEGATLAGALRFSVTPLTYPMRNVVGVVRGSDRLLAHQYVALGAHNDHVAPADQALDHDSVRAFNLVVRPDGAESPRRAATAEEWTRIRAVLDRLRAARAPRADSIYNGADDDGSGSMSLLEVAESFARASQRPKRSLLFVWHVAEEKGLFGSSYFSENPTVPRDSLVAQINLDMVGRGGAGDIRSGGPGYMQVIGSRRLSTELGDLVESVNTDGNHGFTFDYQFDAPGHPQQYFCRSDHYMYARFGIPVVFFSTGSHADYHQVTDEPQYIDYDKMGRVATFVADLARTVANLDHRVVVDKPKPDPNGRCVQ
jgi:Peptidase family M28